jgi:hypothetical protein
MEPVQILQLVVTTLHRLGIPCMVVGSFASSSHGFSRFTQDADIVAKIELEQIGSFIEAFSGEFYVDEGMIRSAVVKGTSFNIIHIGSSFKIDIFVLGNAEYNREAFSRRSLALIDDRTRFEAPIQSAEDAVLSKLNWYRQGGGVSEVQWRDIVGILKVQAEQLDQVYLERWARELGVFGLLAQAIQEAAEQRAK